MPKFVRISDHYINMRYVVAGYPSPFEEGVYVVEMATGHDFLFTGEAYFAARLLFQKEPN